MTQSETYNYKACKEENKELFLRCHKVGTGIRGIARILQISPTTVISWIRKLGSKAYSNTFFKRGDEYEVDELCTYIGDKKRIRWVLCYKCCWELKTYNK